jgi:hypothetical protein
MWLPWLEQLGAPYIVVTRHPSAVDRLSSLTSAPIVSCESWADLDRVVVPSLRVALYVNSLGANADFLTHRELRHVYLGHGESDKALSVHPMHAAYDVVLVAGQAAIDRYAHAGLQIPPERMVVVGRPQVTSIQRADGDPDRDGVVPSVLYAPTWMGYNAKTSYSSLPQGSRIVEQLVDAGCRVVFRPHPFSRERGREKDMAATVDAVLAADRERGGREHLFGAAVDGDSFAAAANASDLMVCDVSSVLTDYLHSGKPVAVVDALGAILSHPEQYPDAAGAYVVAGDLSNLRSVLEDMAGGDTLRDQRLEHRAYVLGPSEPAGERFLAVLRGLAGEPSDTHDVEAERSQ